MVGFFAFVHDVAAKCADVSEERAVCIFRVTRLVKVDSKVIKWKKCVNCVGRVQGVKAVTAAESGKR